MAEHVIHRVEDIGHAVKVVISPKDNEHIRIGVTFPKDYYEKATREQLQETLDRVARQYNRKVDLNKLKE